MTENLLQKLEEKVMLLLMEIEDLRRETQRLKQENSLLRITEENHSKKVADLISALDTSLLDPMHAADNTANHAATPALKPVLVQG